MADIILGGQTFSADDPIARSLISSLLPRIIEQRLGQQAEQRQLSMIDQLLGGGGRAGEGGGDVGQAIYPSTRPGDLVGGGPGAPITLGRDPTTGVPMFTNLGRNIMSPEDLATTVSPEEAAQLPPGFISPTDILAENLRAIGERYNRAATGPGGLFQPAPGIPREAMTPEALAGKPIPTTALYPNLAARMAAQPAQPEVQPTAGKPGVGVANVARLAHTLAKLGVPQKIQEGILDQAMGGMAGGRELEQKRKELMLQAQKELMVDEIKKGRDQARKMNEPLGDKSRLWLNREGLPAAPSMSENDVIKQGYIPVTPQDLSGVASARSAQYNITEYRDLIGTKDKLGKVFLPELSAQGKAGKLNSADLLAVQSNKLNLAMLLKQGDPNVRRLVALQGAIANLARATGDTANIAVAEREMLMQMLPTIGDSRDSALAVLAQADRVVEAILKARGFPTSGKSVQVQQPNPQNQSMTLNKPPARGNRGRVITDPTTGAREISDDTAWVPLSIGGY